MLADASTSPSRPAKAGGSGEEAYRVLVANLRRELDTCMHGAALQQLLGFTAAEGTPFSSFFRAFKML